MRYDLKWKLFNVEQEGNKRCENKKGLSKT